MVLNLGPEINDEEQQFIRETKCGIVITRNNDSEMLIGLQRLYPGLSKQLDPDNIKIEKIAKYLYFMKGFINLSEEKNCFFNYSIGIPKGGFEYSDMAINGNSKITIQNCVNREFKEELKIAKICNKVNIISYHKINNTYLIYAKLNDDKSEFIEKLNKLSLTKNYSFEIAGAGFYNINKIKGLELKLNKITRTILNNKNNYDLDVFKNNVFINKYLPINYIEMSKFADLYLLNEKNLLIFRHINEYVAKIDALNINFDKLDKQSKNHKNREITNEIIKPISIPSPRTSKSRTLSFSTNTTRKNRKNSKTRKTRSLSLNSRHNSNSNYSSSSSKRNALAKRNAFSARYIREARNAQEARILQKAQEAREKRAADKNAQTHDIGAQAAQPSLGAQATGTKSNSENWRIRNNSKDTRTRTTLSWRNNPRDTRTTGTRTTVTRSTEPRPRDTRTTRTRNTVTRSTEPRPINNNWRLRRK